MSRIFTSNVAPQVLTFVAKSNGYRWARLMKKLLCEFCYAVNKSETGVLSEAECRKYRKKYRKKYRTIRT